MQPSRYCLFKEEYIPVGVVKAIHTLKYQTRVYFFNLFAKKPFTSYPPNTTLTTLRMVVIMGHDPHKIPILTIHDGDALSHNLN